MCLVINMHYFVLIVCGHSPTLGCSLLRTVTFYTEDQVWMANEAHYFILMQYIGICSSNFARDLKEAKKRGIPSLASEVQVTYRQTSFWQGEYCEPRGPSIPWE